ncbi:hypothetical protein Aperf_G00000055682 [Anoplocephala perfoliata]
MIGPDLARIERAKEERRKQLLKWDEYDRTYRGSFNYGSYRRGSPGVRFESNLVFLEAASRGDLDEVKKLIKAGIDTNVTNEDGLTALHQCCIDNNLDMCTLLLENGANVNAKDNEQWTPLHAAATCGNKELCELLIKWGADLLALNIDGNMPYDLCDDDDTLILVETEMAKRKVTQQQIDEIRLGPEKEMLSDLKRRHTAGDDLRSLDAQGAAPIHIAASCGYAEVARYLLQLNVDPQQPDQDGWLPIHIAVSWGHLEVIEILVAYGADINAPMKNGQTVNDICDSKELQVRLEEIWDKREELRSAVKKTNMTNNNAAPSFTRGFGSSRRARTSVIRTSMRDKHRLTRTDAEKERELREKVVNEVNKENGSTERVQSEPQNTSMAAAPPSINSAATPLVSVAAASKSRNQTTTNGRDPRLSSIVNGVGSPMTKKGNISASAVPPAVPSRSSRPVRMGGGRMASPQLSPTTSSTPHSSTTTTTAATAKTSSLPSTFTTTASPNNSPSIENQSESSDSQANYLRPMQRKSNGQMIPLSSEPIRSPQRLRPSPSPKDSRGRVPRKSDASSSTLSASSKPPIKEGEVRNRKSTTSPSTVLRQGPLSASQNDVRSSRIDNITPASSVDTVYSGGGSHKPLMCCRTM